MLTVLRRMLAVARKRGLIEVVPDVEWLKNEKPSRLVRDLSETNPRFDACCPKPQPRCGVTSRSTLPGRWPSLSSVLSALSRAAL